MGDTPRERNDDTVHAGLRPGTRYDERLPAAIESGLTVGRYR